MEGLRFAELAGAYWLHSDTGTAPCPQARCADGVRCGITPEGDGLDRVQALVAGETCPRLRYVLLTGSAVTVLAGATVVLTR
ncbi:hypothetical protein QEZ40_005108 [Streptomyces katrae]|uniref:Uncharacterized protein n=1 Tax=Streptomyces katrae TaxID=68223 RepID=A0ABT7H1A6_9ACTN|nr:hypothetical protein [Streptomyces katrae]MDK9499676.1 hypothetical protein [Streptomyces katrae]